MKHTVSALALGALVTAGVAAPRAAHACGGFFCSQSQPVNQTAERILFVQVDADTVEAHVQIQYAGPSERFSWIVPVPSEPEVGVGLDVVFRLMSGQTVPRFALDRQTIGTCREDGWGGDAGTDVSADTAVDVGFADTADAGSPPGVEVVDQGEVGPYDYAVLAAESVDPMLEWLADNGYDIPAATGDLLEGYLGGGTHFVAIKLTKDADVGDLRPLTLRFAARSPMIPLRLTSVAATPALQVDTWILANDPARPADGPLVEMNPLRTYFDGWLLTGRAAVDEVDGMGFVRPSVIDDPLNTLALDFTEQVVALRDATGSYADAVRTLPGTFAWLSSSGLPPTAVMDTCFPLPDVLAADGVGAEEYWARLRAYAPDAPGDAWLGAGCADAVRELYIEPLTHLTALFESGSVLTRLTTWLDPEEMTLDPGFCYAPDDPLTVTQTVTRTQICHPDLYVWEAPVRAEVDGVALTARSDAELVDLARSLPAARRAWSGTFQGRCGDAVEAVSNEATSEAAARDAAAEVAAWLDTLETGRPPVPDAGPDDAGGGGADAGGPSDGPGYPTIPVHWDDWPTDTPAAPGDDAPTYVPNREASRATERGCASASTQGPAWAFALFALSALRSTSRRRDSEPGTGAASSR